MIKQGALEAVFSSDESSNASKDTDDDGGVEEGKHGERDYEEYKEYGEF